jgi:hypothetical protein
VLVQGPITLKPMPAGDPYQPVLGDSFELVMAHQFDDYGDLYAPAVLSYNPDIFDPDKLGNVLKLPSLSNAEWSWEVLALPTGLTATVIPEPSTLILLATGLAGLLVWRRRI